ncbi:hypothetical protein PENSPDRAFT_682573 [Peniophora sp. CONT]|nr:hypothetical protein PENSPDRAFT_682573 [Peniophora sp. CONT]
MDDSYCASCSRYILPKRHQVPVYSAPTSVPDQQPPSVPPPSPTSASPEKALVKTRSKQGTIRARGGLARGTGRVKANGTLATATKKPAEPAAQPTPVKHRTVIDQGPTPLYCSDECRLADLEERHAAISADFNPLRDLRASPPLPAAPHNSLAGSSDESSSSSSEASSSPDAHDGLHVPDYISWESVSPSVAALAKMYDWSPLPARPAAVVQQEQEDAAEAAEVTSSLEETYTSGVMMAAERIKDALTTPPPQQPSKSHLRHSAPAPSRAREPIPGWTDGSDAWRASVYSMSPKDTEIRGMKKPEERPRAYGSFAASPHRSTGGVYSTVSSDPLQTPTAGNLPTRANTTSDVAQYPLSFARRTDSRTSLSSGSQSLPTSTRSRSLVKKGAEGQLLVPDVTLTVRSPASVASTGSSSWRSSSQRSLVRSPLSRYGSDLSVSVESEEEHEQQSTTSKTTPTKRPTVETRSWSYDHMLTYEVMPMKAEPSTLKRLFLFPGKPTASPASAATPTLSARV